MKTILLFGAGKSASCLIDYLGKSCDENHWELLVCDANISLAKSKIHNYASASAISFDVIDTVKRHELVSKASLVISMLPPAFHFLVAQDCVLFSKNLLTASYIDEKIKSLKNEIEKKQILFLGEMGLDPGIDHMSAMKMINEIKKEGGQISSFKSHCGGLVSPESDDNPWHYKITWNPANVVSAGSAGAVYLDQGKKIEIPYSQIFNDEKNVIDVPGLFPLAWYANRNSLSYTDTYELHDVATFIRTTLRYPAFCRGWNKIVKLKLTSKIDTDEIKDCTTIKEWFNLKKGKLFSADKNHVHKNQFFDSEFSNQITYLGLDRNEIIPPLLTNSAAILQWILEKELVMKSHDKDMIVMLHEIQFSINGTHKKRRSCLIVKGDDQVNTAMAKTVGLPLGIAAKLILQNEIKLIGLHIPVIAEIYEPVLKELELNGIKFNEETEII